MCDPDSADYSPTKCREMRAERGDQGEGTVEQTLIFAKDQFSRSAAVAWARENDFRADKVDETENSFRLRQRAPGEFRRFAGTIRLTTGVQAVIGLLK